MTSRIVLLLLSGLPPLLAANTMPFRDLFL